MGWKGEWMTLVLCPECGRMLATVSMQTKNDRHHAVLVCRPCERTYRMTLEEDERILDERREKILKELREVVGKLYDGCLDKKKEEEE